MSNEPAIKLDFEDESDHVQRAPPDPGNNRFDQLYGSLRIVSSVPTWTPRGRIAESIALYSSGGIRRLYVYDYQTSTWHYSALT